MGSCDKSQILPSQHIWLQFRGWNHVHILHFIHDNHSGRIWWGWRVSGAIVYTQLVCGGMCSNLPPSLAQDCGMYWRDEPLTTWGDSCSSYRVCDLWTCLKSAVCSCGLMQSGAVPQSCIFCGWDPCSSHSVFTLFWWRVWCVLAVSWQIGFFLCRIQRVLNVWVQLNLMSLEQCHTVDKYLTASLYCPCCAGQCCYGGNDS